MAADSRVITTYQLLVLKWEGVNCARLNHKEK
jgi:hypothetical protein